MKFLHFYLLALLISFTQSSIYNHIKDRVRSMFEKSKDSYEMEHGKKGNGLEYFRQQKDDASDAKRAHFKARVLKKARSKEDRLNYGRDMPSFSVPNDPKMGKDHYHMDPVLNQLNRRLLEPKSPGGPEGPKGLVMRQGDSGSSSLFQSSSIELKNWKDEFREHWMYKKFEAMNTSAPQGDTVNMAAARPWGVPCGDPNQHDMPWGTCMMRMECDGEFRIYRGDYFCGKSQYVCCALQLNTYDLYQGFDVSFAGSSFQTDSREIEENEKGMTKKKRVRKTNKRRQDRRRRKKKMKKHIRNIVREIRKILNRAFRNSSMFRKRRTQLLKQYIRDLKKQFKKDRKAVRDVHTGDVDRINTALEKRLEQLSAMNRNFMMNATFRDIIVNGTINKKGARMLAEAYPELKTYLPNYKPNSFRRSGGGLPDPEKNYLEYDIEYGAFYY